MAKQIIPLSEQLAEAEINFSNANATLTAKDNKKNRDAVAAAQKIRNSIQEKITKEAAAEAKKIEKAAKEKEAKQIAAQEKADEEKEETRGRKPKEMTADDLQNKAKELILDIRAYVKIRQGRGKSITRLNAAASDIERMLRTHLID